MWLTPIFPEGLFMLRAVLNGRGDEIVDLARINLFRQSRKIASR
jgi:hypothetical protein